MILAEIRKTIALLQQRVIPEDRRDNLLQLTAYLQKRIENKLDINLNFICTHNSRRSLLAQAWTQVMAAHFGIERVTCYSGGTEATAVFPEVLLSLKNAGFEISTISAGANPVHAIKYGGNTHPVMAFSKKFNDPFNPQSEFAAIMTCAEADEACPFVPGAEMRIPIAYEDPKRYDNTPQQEGMYRERSLEIAGEIYYAFSQIAQQR